LGDSSNTVSIFICQTKKLKKLRLHKMAKHISPELRLEVILSALLEKTETPMDYREASSFLKISEKTLKTKRNLYPHHKIEGQVYFYRSELNNFIKQI